MKKFILLSIVLLSLLVTPLSEVFAQARLINYQGNILNQLDQPYEGPVQITFELYSAEFGGSQLWSEIQNVTLNKGYFNVYLGSVSPFAANFNFNRNLWLQVTVGKGSPYQRTMLSMVPYSGYSDRSAIAGFAEDIPDGSVTLIKLADEVINMGGDLTGQLPNPRLRPGAILEGIPDGSITQAKLDPNVTVRPSGPASGDLTGFYPDPQIAAGAVKTDRLADGAVINSKIADFTIMYNKLQNASGPIGTVLGWDGTKWIETNVPAWEIGRIKAIVAGDGNYVNNVTDAQGFITTTVGIANDGVTTAKIANDAVTYAKIQNAMGANGTILAWNGTNWVENTVPALEADAVIGNEVLNATPNLGLVRAGAGTAASPYTLGIAESGVVTNMIAMDAVTYDKIQNAAGPAGTILSWNGGHWVENNVPALEMGRVKSVVAGDGNFVTNATDAQGFITSTVGIADNGVTTAKINNGAVTRLKFADAVGPIGTIFSWNGTTWIENTVSALEADGVIGNELLDATAGRGLVRAGAGTAANPYTIGIAEEGIVNSMIEWNTIEYNRLQNAAGPIGTIIGWNGTSWIETNVPAWEKGKVMAVTAGAGTTVTNTTDGQGFISAQVGIANQGVTNAMLAPGAVSLDKLAAGNQIGQIMWWDQAANQWRFSTGAAPTQDYVIKWIDAGGSLTPQWAPDDMTIPYAKTITENAQTLFALTNNGNSDVMSLTTTGKGDGLHINLTEDLIGGGHALHLDGAGFEKPALMINRLSQYGLPQGAAYINSTINSLDAASAGMVVNTTVIDDGNNSYDVEGIQSLLNVTNGVNDVFYTGVWGVGNSDNGIATGVWGDANAVNAQSNFGVIGAAYDAANTNIGVAGVANDANYQGYTTLLPPGFGAGVVAMNAGLTAMDFGVFADAKGAGTGVQAQAVDGSALVAANESDVEPTVFAFNNGTNSVFLGVNTSDVAPTAEFMNFGDGTALSAMSSTTEGLYTADITNFGDGRGLAVTGGKLNDENGGLPFLQDPTDDDDAALVVRNPNAGPGVFATAIKTYGDIWANSAVGANQIIGLNSLIVGNPYGLFIEILPPAFPGAPLTIDGDVEIVGDLTVEDIFADDITANTLTVALGTFDNLQVNINANVDGATTLNTLTVGGATVLNNTLTQNGGGQVTFSGNVNANMGLDVIGAATVVGPTTLTGTLSQVGGGQVAFSGNVDANMGLDVVGAATVVGPTTLTGTLSQVGGGQVAFSGNVDANMGLDVVGATTLTGTVNQIGGGQVTFSGNVDANNGLDVVGAANVTGATTLNGTLSQVGGGQVAFSGNVDANMGLDVLGVTNLTGAVNQIGGAQVTFSGNVDANNGLDVVGAATVAGPTTLTGTLSQVGGGQVTFSGNVDANSGLDVTGASNLNGATTVTGATTLNGTLTQNGGGQVTLSGNVDANNGLDVLGVTNLTGAVNQIGGGQVTISGNVDANNGLDVMGATTLGGTLGVTGVATFANNVNLNGSNLTLSNSTRVIAGGVSGAAGHLFVSRGAVLSPEWTNSIPSLIVTDLEADDLLVNNDAQIDGNLEVNGTTVTINADVTMVGDFDLTGKLTVDDLEVLNSTRILNDFEAVTAIFEITAPLVDITGALGVVGNTNLTGTLGVTGATTIGGATQINNTLGVTGNTLLGGNLQVNGTSDLRGVISNGTGNLTIVDNVDITGITTINGNLTVQGPGQGQISGTSLSLTQNATVGQNLTVAQNTTVGGHTSINTLDVIGAIVNPISAAAPVFVNDNLDVAGNVTIGGGVVILGDLTATNINATNNLTAGNNLTVTNNGSFGGALAVVGNYTSTNGNITLTNGTINAENGDIDASFNVDGATTLGGTLGVTGATTLNNTLSQVGGGQVTFSGNVDANNGLDVVGAANVTGATTLTGTLSQVGGGQVTFSGNVDANNGLDVVGAANVTGATTLTGTLGVTGLGTFNNGLTVTAGLTNVQALQATTGTFSGAITGASLTTTGNVNVGTNLVVTGTITGALVNSLTEGAGITPFTYNNGAAATVAIAPLGVVNGMIADNAVNTIKIIDDAVTYAKLQNAGGAAGTILNWDGANWVETTVGALEVDGVIGNEVLDATVGGGLVRAGAGTTGVPYTLGVAPMGIVTAMINDGSVNSAKILDDAIVDADVNSAAAIAGTKISPNFGAQNVVTTGNVTATGITATTGNIVATAGQVNAGTSMTAGTSITAGTALVAGTSVSAITDITTTTGNVNAAAGTVNALNGNFTGTLAAGNTTITGTITQVGAVLNTFAGNIVVNGTSNFNSTLTAQNLIVSTNATITGQLSHDAVTVTTADWTIANAEFLGLNQVSFVDYQGAVNVPLGTPGSIGSILYVFNNTGAAFTFVATNVPAGQVLQFINTNGTMTGWVLVQ